MHDYKGLIREYNLQFILIAELPGMRTLTPAKLVYTQLITSIEQDCLLQATNPTENVSKVYHVIPTIRHRNKTCYILIADVSVDLSVWKLRKLYLSNGIKFRPTQMVYRQHMLKRTELDIDRWRFAKRLMEVVMNDDEPYGFFEEMALHSFLCPGLQQVPFAQGGLRFVLFRPAGRFCGRLTCSM